MNARGEKIKTQLDNFRSGVILKGSRQLRHWLPQTRGHKRGLFCFPFNLQNATTRVQTVNKTALSKGETDDLEGRRKIKTLKMEIRKEDTFGGASL